MCIVCGWVNELKVYTKYSPRRYVTKNLREKPATIRLGKVQENLEKILRGYLCSFGMSVLMVLARR